MYKVSLSTFTAKNKSDRWKIRYKTIQIPFRGKTWKPAQAKPGYVVADSPLWWRVYANINSKLIENPAAPTQISTDKGFANQTD